MYVAQLATEAQNAIKNDLINIGINGKNLEDAMDSRVIDLEDTIDVRKYLR